MQCLKKYQKGKPTSNIYTQAWDWSDTVLHIKSKWSIGFEAAYPVTLSLFRILTISCIYKCYGKV